MNVIFWEVDNGLVDISTDKHQHTIPVKNIVRLSRDKPGEYASGTIVTLIVAGNALPFAFCSMKDAAVFRADVRLAWIDAA